MHIMWNNWVLKFLIFLHCTLQKKRKRQNVKENGSKFKNRFDDIYYILLAMSIETKQRWKDEFDAFIDEEVRKFLSFWNFQCWHFYFDVANSKIYSKRVH